MRKQFFYFVFIIILTPLFLFGCSTEQANVGRGNIDSTNLFGTPINASEISSDSTRAVVGIECTMDGYRSVGTGVAVADGIILSNAHVVGDNSNVTLYLVDGSKSTGNVIWTDTTLDLSIISTKAVLPYLTLEDKDNVVVGEEVIAIGTPIDIQFQQTVTKGIVSALNRTVLLEDNESYLQDMIQHDASINPGNSGGPLINRDGKVIGINTLKVSSAEGLGFAIPVNAAKNVIKHIVKDGTYTTPYMGVYGVDSQVAKYYNLEVNKEGVLVISIDNNGPMAKAGIQKSDLITSINGVPIGNMLDLRTELFKSKVGDSMLIEYVRNNQTYSTTVLLTAK